MFSSFFKLSSIIRIFWFSAHFFLLSFLHIILILGKKWARLFLIPLICNIFFVFFGSLGFYPFPILRWDLLRLFGEANGRGSNFRFSVLFSNSYVFLKFFFNFQNDFWNTGRYIDSGVHREFVFFVFFVFFWTALGPNDIFSYPKKMQSKHRYGDFFMTLCIILLK